MVKEFFSVHKYVVQNNRMGFYSWAMENGYAHIYDLVSKEWVNLDNYNNDRVPLEIVSQEYNQIASLIDEPNLGLKVVQNYNLQRSPFYYVMKFSLEPILSRNIELPEILVLRMASHYYGMMTEVVAMHCEEYNHNIVVDFKPNLPELVSKHQIEGMMFAFSRLVHNFIDKRPVGVQFTHQQEVVNSELYHQTFYCQPTFSHDMNKLIYRTSAITHESDYPLLINPIIHAIKMQFPQMLFNEMVRIILQVTLGFISPTRENIARTLSVSIRTMQRRLKEEGMNFNDILLEVRKNRIHHYLNYSQLTLDKISLLLGYKATSQFHKAFRSWFGLTPKEYRAKI